MAPDPPTITAASDEVRPGSDALVERQQPQHGRPEPEQRLADLEAAHEQDQLTIVALRQRVAGLEEELRLAGPKGSLAEFFAQVRGSKMRVVVEAG